MTATRRDEATVDRKNVQDASVPPQRDERTEEQRDWGDAAPSTRAEEPTKRAKDRRDAVAAAYGQGWKSREAVAKVQRRNLFRHTHRKSRASPMTRSAVRSRGNAQTRRRKESRR